MATPRVALFRSLSLSLVSLLMSAGCGDDFVSPEGGTITLGANDGIDFHTGLLQDPGNFMNSDLFATENGDSGMKLATGGESPTSGRPVIWFRTPGQTLETYESLDAVPSTVPEKEDLLPHAKTGIGFVLQTAKGDYVRGWVSVSESTSVTIEWARE